MSETLDHIVLILKLFHFPMNQVEVYQIRLGVRDVHRSGNKRDRLHSDIEIFQRDLR